MKHPNIIIVFMDDMGYGDMGCFGSPLVKTPRMDKLAEEGIKFTNMYAAAAICSPSRAALLTGRQPQRLGIPGVLVPQSTNGIGTNENTIAGLLKGCGYRTMMTGKWHIGCLPEHNPVRHGFDEFVGLLYSNDMEPLHLYRGEEAIETEVDQAQLTRRYTDEIIRFIEDDPQTPFFCYLAHTMPHIPLHVEPEFRGKSKGGTYGDTIECIDYHLGRLLDKIDELGLRDDTFVIVTSDNGPWFEGSTGGLRGRKFELYEGGIRMPFVARYPGYIQPGTVCDDPASLMDLLPTLLPLAGGELPQDRAYDGFNIGPAFQGEAIPDRPLYFYARYMPCAMRYGKWKLHVTARGPRNEPERREMPQLFDMTVDPQENYNLANLYPEVVQDLKAKFEAFYEDVCRENPQARFDDPF